MATNNVPCTNPAAHGVQHHILGTAAADECARMSGQPGRATKAVGLGVPVSATTVRPAQTSVDWERRLRSASGHGEDPDDYERGDPMNVGLRAIRNGASYDGGARVAAAAEAALTKVAATHSSPRSYIESGDQSYSRNIGDWLTLKVEREGDGYRTAIRDENGNDWTADERYSFVPRDQAEKAIEYIIDRPDRSVSDSYRGRSSKR